MSGTTGAGCRASATTSASRTPTYLFSPVAASRDYVTVSPSMRRERSLRCKRVSSLEDETRLRAGSLTRIPRQHYLLSPRRLQAPCRPAPALAARPCLHSRLLGRLPRLLQVAPLPPAAQGHPVALLPHPGRLHLHCGRPGADAHRARLWRHTAAHGHDGHPRGLA